MEKVLKFPKNFLWGSSTSAYQVEGGIKNSDWAKFKDASIACDHYNRYEEDFDLLKKLNQNVHRFSIEWSRIEPKEGEFDEKEIEHYRKVLLALRERKIIPFVALYNYSIPLWFREKGSWLNPKSPEYFERYVEKIMENLGEYADFWVTINEPLVYSTNSYLDGEWPPQGKSLLKTARVIKRLIKAHQKAYSVIHQFNKKAKVSIAKSNFHLDPYKNKLINKVLVGISNYFWNDYFLKSIKKEMDFVGLNYYFHVRIKFGWNNPRNWFSQNENKEVSDIGWEIYPEGIYHVLKDLRKYNLPIYIVENGLADAKDKFRKDFIKKHLYWIHKAIEEGIDVRGYLHWSLIDNFEWAKGFGPRFGLAEVDYKTLERKPRSSAFYYAQICKSNVLEINN